ncbi:hypothetical protein BS50DRAFT_576568 [Corynespora cassiicola Philippines]|uniref:Uncharacterized protein n=1 Tax=Corynespora cassiicola Philippines TaxID=1448308 RepID=A0A2T2NF95_CORCC|nr:hypothetical protein BS50DRAFT_576568 [Corynespora cassiicola Philippines]
MAKDRHSRKRPFTGWMKRLANLKGSNSTSDAPPQPGKKGQPSVNPKSKKQAAKNNPYPESGHFNANGNGHLSFSSPVTPRSNESFTSVEDAGSGNHRRLAKSNKSTAPTVATNNETIRSGRSKAETGHSNTIGGGSTFSSPNHSERSLTTTLTTIQSSAPSNVLAGIPAQPAQQSSGPPVHFSHQFPTSPPPSAIPPHLNPQSHPQSYQGATANNMLTDNASILTLASSSKRRRRNSLDTNASVRALAPSSVWGGSRESLPLSVLSSNVDTIYSPQQNRHGVGGLASAERASLYSASGVAAPAISSERNSYYANKQNADGLSVRSGLLGHGRTDSITGSIGPTATSPLASPRDPIGPGRISRRSSEWKDAVEGGESSDGGDSPTSPVSQHEGKGKAKAAA